MLVPCRVLITHWAALKDHVIQGDPHHWGKEGGPAVKRELVSGRGVRGVLSEVASRLGVKDEMEPAEGSREAVQAEVGGTERRLCREAEGEAEEAQPSQEGGWMHPSAGGVLKASAAACPPRPTCCPAHPHCLAPTSCPSAPCRCNQRCPKCSGPKAFVAPNFYLVKVQLKSVLPATLSQPPISLVCAATRHPPGALWLKKTAPRGRTRHPLLTLGLPRAWYATGA